MKDKKCILCKVVDGSLPSFKIWEDDDFIAVLDLYPNTKGQTMVISKKHLPSYQFDIDDERYIQALKAAKSVGKLLEQKLKVKRIALVIEGMGINHLHIKLYPLHGLTKTFKETRAKETIYFENYKGYISTLTGPRADNKDLEAIRKMIMDSYTY